MAEHGRAWVVAIDGPGGSGKSTVARALAARLGVTHVDTGAHYRAATLAVLRAGVDRADAQAVVDAVRRSRVERRGGRTLLDGEDVEDEIRGATVTAAVSGVSRLPAVRVLLVERQRAEVGDRGAVVEGRDAATVVVPGADLKVWLTASAATRAARRAAQVGETDPARVAAHSEDLARRDRLDAEQMARAPDAVVVDTTGVGVAALVDDLVRRLPAPGQAHVPGSTP